NVKTGAALGVEVIGGIQRIFLIGGEDFGASLSGSKLAFGIGGFYDYNLLTIKSTSNINTGQWIHVAMTRKESTGDSKLYINGVLEASGNTQARGAMQSGGIRIGGRTDGNNFFNGSLDDIRIWNVVRTENQIKSGMNNSYPADTATLTDNFTFNENTGATTDNLSSATNGTLMNGPTWVNRSTNSNYSSYLWSNGATTPTITASTSGQYSVTVTDATGCTGSSAPVQVTSASPLVTVSPTSVLNCSGSPTTLTATGALTYSWSPATGLSATTGNSVIASPSVTTTYTVTGTNAAGCGTSTASVTVTVDSVPSLQIAASQNFISSGGSATLVASGGTTYSWSPASGLNTTTGATVTASPSVTTTYTLTSNCGATKTITITVLPSASAGDNALQFDGVDDSVLMPLQSTPVTGTFTVAVWVKPMDATKVMHIFSTRNGSNGDTFDIQLRYGNQIHGDIGKGAGWLTTSADASVNYSANTWMHIAYVVTPSDYKIYANGNLAASGGYGSGGTPVLYGASNSISLGRNNADGTFFNGALDDLKLFSSALSQQQIIEVARSQAISATPLAA
ncbi:MAG: LamG domain-containing protein, partial [Sphingobacteriales bacterium]